ncbi:hypothetical protein [Parasediminibacterium sp. JCM 36343]|uniref:hypothetical protein n=1 Tax=Parasediminibacterium sp. JCM 36343 TaxID=3374279 RepID=UPI00397D58AC
MNTQEFKKVLSMGILATSAMTIFSYLVSELMSENFREPEIMAIFIKDLLPTAKQCAPYFAWCLHYIIGFSFVIIYMKLWDNNKLKPNLQSGMFLGAITGIFGIIGWYITLKIYHNPLNTNIKDFFILLFFAHIVFGIFAMIGYALPKKRTDQIES